MVISPGDGRPLQELLTWITLLGEAGAPGLLLREPNRPIEAIRQGIMEASKHPLFLALHERCGSLEDSRVHATHLKSSSRPRQSSAFGQSCHNQTELEAAFAAGAVYALLSPVFSPYSKPNDDRATLGISSYLKQTDGRPVLALGGINGARYREIRALGGYGAAALGDFAQIDTPELAQRKLAEYALNP